MSTYGIYDLPSSPSMSFKSSRPIAKLIPSTIVSVIKSQKKNLHVFKIFMQRRLFLKNELLYMDDSVSSKSVNILIIIIKQIIKAVVIFHFSVIFAKSFNTFGVLQSIVRGWLTFVKEIVHAIVQTVALIIRHSI